MLKNKVAERLFQAGAGALMLVAAYFLWLGDFDRVFVLAAIGSLFFFIGIRFQVKERLEIRSAGIDDQQLSPRGGSLPRAEPSGIEIERLKENDDEYF